MQRLAGFYAAFHEPVPLLRLRAHAHAHFYAGGAARASGAEGGANAEPASGITATAAAAQQPAAAEEDHQLEWPRCMDDMGASNKLCSEALARVIGACPGSAQLLWGGTSGRSGRHTSRGSFLPFLS